jgi:hypothetical protein
MTNIFVQNIQPLLKDVYSLNRFLDEYFMVSCQQKIDQEGLPYWSIKLSDATKTIVIVYRDKSDIQSMLTPMSIVVVDVAPDLYHGSPYFRCNFIAFALGQETIGSKLTALPSAVCSNPSILNRLIDAVSFIQSFALRQFVESVILQTEVALNLLTLHSPLNDCRKYDGGLLEHLLEVAEMTCRGAPDNKKDLAIVAGILHYIGYVRAINTAATNAQLGYAQHIAQLNLVVCEEALNHLKNVSYDEYQELHATLLAFTRQTPKNKLCMLVELSCVYCVAQSKILDKQLANS